MFSCVDKEKIEQIISSLTLDQKLSQLFIVGYYGDSPDEALLEWIDQYLGGLILFRENITSPIVVAKVIENYQKLSKIGLFISIDQEGGLVERVKGLTQIPTPMALAAIDDDTAITAANDILAEELKLLGFNLNFTPVLDVNKEPTNPVIGIRSFGDDPCVVSKHGMAVIETMRKHKIIPAVKHFPGHGAASIDSHLALPTINITLDQLWRDHLTPFKVAIDNNVEMLMLCHVYFKSISEVEGLPASLSKNIVSGLLVEEMNYKGVIITDDLDMNAIKTLYPVELAAEMALNAGVDILLYRNYKNARLAYTYILSKLKQGEISEDRINQSLRKILALKLKYSICDNNYCVDENVIKAHIRTIEKINRAQTLFDSAITIYKPLKSPLKLDNKSSILVISVDREELVHYKSEGNLNLGTLLGGVDEVKIPINPNEADITQIMSLIERYYLLIIISYNAFFNPNQTLLINNVLKVKSGCILSAGSPYDALLFPQAQLLALSYGYSNASILSFYKLLNGEINGNTNNPVNIPI